jgi:2,3-bisphosphoglycerate-independent phosphoglycerate mutase
VVYDPAHKGEYGKRLAEGLGISSLAALCIELLGFTPPKDYDKSPLSFV